MKRVEVDEGVLALPVVSGALGGSEVRVVSAIPLLGGTGGPGGVGGNGGRGGSGIGGRGGWTIGVACFDSNPIMGRVFVRTSAPGDSLGALSPVKSMSFMGVIISEKGSLKCF